MALPFVLTIGIILWVLQLVLCFRGRRMLLKLLPLILGGVLDAVCWLVLLVDSRWACLPYGAGMSAYILGLLILLWLAAAVFAWLIYGIVKGVQKRRK